MGGVKNYLHLHPTDGLDTQPETYFHHMSAEESERYSMHINAEPSNDVSDGTEMW